MNTAAFLQSIAERLCPACAQHIRHVSGASADRFLVHRNGDECRAARLWQSWLSA